MICRSGCPSQDHESYGECLRAAGVRVAYAQSHKGLDATKQKRWDRELAEYRELKAEGMQPAGTTRHALDQAKTISDTTGTAYRAA